MSKKYDLHLLEIHKLTERAEKAEVELVEAVKDKVKAESEVRRLRKRIRKLWEDRGEKEIPCEPLRHQPCGCILCCCEDEEQCHGCGAKMCKEHTELGYIPNLVYAKRSEKKITGRGMMAKYRKKPVVIEAVQMMRCYMEEPMFDNFKEFVVWYLETLFGCWLVILLMAGVFSPIGLVWWLIAR